MRANCYYGWIFMFFLRGCLCCIPLKDAVYLPVPEASCTFSNKTTCSYNAMPDWQPTEGQSVNNQSSTTQVLLTSGQDDDFYLLFRPVNSTNISITLTLPKLPADKYQITFGYAMSGKNGVLALKTLGSSTYNTTQHWNTTNGVNMNWTHQMISFAEHDTFTLVFSAYEDDNGFVGLDNIEVCRACVALNLIHGQVVYKNTSAEFHCDDGYVLNGSASISCNLWTWAATPICQPIDCGHLIPPDHGYVNASNTILGSVSTITCDHGHLLVGEKTSTCKANKRWNNTGQTCIPIDCGHLTVPVHGTVSSNESVLGTTVTISCDTGYILNGSSTSQCEKTGRWSSTCHMCVPANGSSDLPQIIGRTCIGDCSFTNNNTCGYTFGDLWSVWNGDYPFESRQLSYSAVSDDPSFALFEPPFFEKTITLPYTSTRLMPAGAACLSFDVQFFNILPRSMGTLYVSTKTSENGTTAIRNITGTGLTHWDHIQGLVVDEYYEYYVDFLATSVNHALIGIDDIRLESLYCGVGYKPVMSEVHAYCNKSRSELPSCEHIDCGLPKSPSNGSVAIVPTIYGSNVTFACNKGYTLNGSLTATCLRNGKWSSIDQSCIIIDCGALPLLTNGNITFTEGTGYGSIANLTCNAGFNLTGESVSACTINGIWNSTNQTCVPIDCGSPPEVVNGTVHAKNTTFGSVATLMCDVGYKVTGSNVFVCSSNGVWNNTDQTCYIVDCGLLPVLTNGTITYIDNTTFGSTAILECDKGYNLQGGNHSKCTGSGQWVDPYHRCDPVDCGPLKASYNADLTARTTTYGTVSNIKCKSGYIFDGNDSIYCDFDGSWANINFTCTIVDCGRRITPRVHQNVTYFQNTTTVWSSVFMQCEVGYNIEKNRFRESAFCAEDGNWTNSKDLTKIANSFRDCILVDCGVFPLLKNGTIRYTENTTYKSIANLECDEGYNLDGRDYSECESYGSWDYRNQYCKIVDCGQLDAKLHANLTASLTTYGMYSGIKCNEGYLFDGNDTAYCDSDGIWKNYNFTCTIVDCGTIYPRQHQDISYIGNLTTYGSRAIMVCESGYFVNNSFGRNSELADCEADGNWTMSNFNSCVPVECPWFPLNDWVEMDIDTQIPLKVNTSINFHCKAGFSLIGYINIKCLPNGQWSGSQPKCKKENIIYSDCPRNKDTLGRNWAEISPGGIQTLPCSDVDSIGIVFRRCSNEGEWMLPVDGCVRREIETIYAQVKAIERNPTKESIVEYLDKLASVTNVTKTEAVGIQGKSVAKTTSGELKKVTNILDRLVNASASVSVVTSTQYEPFLETTSNLLDGRNTYSWKSINQNSDDEENESPGALKVLHVVDRYTRLLSKSKTSDSITANTENIVMHVRKINTDDIDWFPSAKDDVTIKSHVSLHVPRRSQPTSFAAVVYRNLSGILSSNTMYSGAEISSEVVAVTLDNALNNPGLTISLTLGYFPGSSGEPHCSFWNNTRSGWDSSGCNLTSFNDTSSTCVCNHLTNFAILMSPWTENVDTLALDVISMVGCSVSMLGLIITVGLHVYLWRYVKSDRVIILMNLSLALILSYAVFIGGVDRTENKAGCTAIAILQHYIYLAVFFLMLAEGIEIGITILYVLPTTSRLKWLLPAAWALPAVIVGISMGATQLAGYGNGQNCWLSIEGGLIWAFVAPAALIIVVNFVVLVLVINAMLRTKSLSEKSRSERSKAGVRCLCVLLPLMGCTWVIGLFFVNESMAWVQYVFAVCNSLQGLVIFIFHCVLNVQIRNALQKQKHKKHSQSFMSTNKTFVSTSFAEDSLALPRISLKQNAVRRSFSSGHDE